ncbi:cell wall anchor protein [Bdellovibrio sp. 22V]|uniref:beta strand repeat-containing protein n=1 Tax=Bdellovibrio TaxID=958 RepID=UPI002543175A|nr:cell wall anchor protein [Bdellovibrio sp. 22V]WII71441.1 cell wall anchor protein [Bdellovibrio sp. 22V]
MKKRNVIGIFILILINSSLAFAAPGSLTYQGRIKNAQGDALEVNGVQFEFTIMNPTGSCALYRETSSAVDMRNSGGVFDVPIGTGTKNYPAAAGFKLLDSFDNATTFNCEGGGVYTPLTDDKRVLRVQFYDGTGWKLITPDSEIRSVPFAGHAKVAQTAQKLGTYAAADFVAKADLPFCGAGEYLRHIAPAGTFECTAPSVSGSNVTGNIAGSAAGFTGNLSGDVSGAQTATSVDKIKGVAVDMTGIASGKVLKYNGTQWAPADDQGTTGALTGLSGDVSSSGSPTATVTLNDNTVSTNKIVDGAVTSSKIDDGTIVNADIAAGAAIADSKLATISTAGKVSGDAVTSGTIGGSTAINTSGLIQTSNGVRVYQGSNYVELKAPTTLATDLTLRFPDSAGSNGQVLTTNGAGVLSWSTPSSGSVTSVTATAPVVSSGGATPVISLADSVTAGSYAKVTVSAKGLVTAGGTLANTDIPNLSGDVTSIAGTNSTTVEKIRGVNVSTTTPQTGHTFVHNGTDWVPQFFGFGQLRSTVTGTAQMPASCATADKTLTWSAITDTFACTTIAIANTQVTGLGTAATKNFGTAAGNLVELDGTGKIPSSLLPSSGTNIVDGGNTTGATITIGTNDAQKFAFKTNNATAVTIGNTGFVGIGTTSPGAKLDVSGGAIRSMGVGGKLHVKGEAFSANGGTTDAVAIFEKEAIGGVGLNLYTTNGNRASIYFGDTGTITHGAIKYNVNSSTFSNQRMDFVVNNAERMVINGSGNVGIGTLTPGTGIKLDVNGIARSTASIVAGGTPTLEVRDTDNTNAEVARTNYISFTDSVGTQSGYIGDGLGTANGLTLTTTQPEPVSIATNSVERMVVDSSGNVVIGAASTTKRFEVQKAFNGLTNVTAAFIGGTDNLFGNTGIYVLQKDNTGFASANTKLVNVVINDVSKLTVTGEGNVGVDVTTPTSKLHVNGGIKQPNFGQLVSIWDGTTRTTNMPAFLTASYMDTHQDETFTWRAAGPRFKDTVGCGAGPSANNFFDGYDTTWNGTYRMTIGKLSATVYIVDVEWKGWGTNLRDPAGAVVTTNTNLGSVYATVAFDTSTGVWSVQHMQGLVGNVAFTCH